MVELYNQKGLIYNKEDNIKLCNFSGISSVMDGSQNNAFFHRF